MINFMSAFDRWATKNPRLTGCLIASICGSIMFVLFMGIVAWEKDSLRKYGGLPYLQNGSAASGIRD